jgi:hypothetical protein
MLPDVKTDAKQKYGGCGYDPARPSPATIERRQKGTAGTLRVDDAFLTQRNFDGIPDTRAGFVRGTEFRGSADNQVQFRNQG